MSDVLEEVQRSILELGLSNSVVQLNDQDTKSVYESLLNEFVIGGDRRWWWEAFRHESFGQTFSNGKGFEHITDLVPDIEEIVWFVVEDDQLPFYPIFESSTENAKKIIGDCFAYEYYLIPKNMKWLVCETHHNRIIVIGSDLISELKNEKM